MVARAHADRSNDDRDVRANRALSDGPRPGAVVTYAGKESRRARERTHRELGELNQAMAWHLPNPWRLRAVSERRILGQSKRLQIVCIAHCDRTETPAWLVLSGSGRPPAALLLEAAGQRILLARQDAVVAVAYDFSRCLGTASLWRQSVETPLLEERHLMYPIGAARSVWDVESAALAATKSVRAS